MRGSWLFEDVIRRVQQKGVSKRPFMPVLHYSIGIVQALSTNVSGLALHMAIGLHKVS